MQEAEPSIMDASEDDQLAAAIAASMQGNNDGESDEGEMKQAEDHQEEKREEEKAQEPVVALTPEPEGTWSAVCVWPCCVAREVVTTLFVSP
jgi:hypothetical protein